jgi:hypothetical protein
LRGSARLNLVDNVSIGVIDIAIYRRWFDILDGSWCEEGAGRMRTANELGSEITEGIWVNCLGTAAVERNGKFFLRESDENRY